MTRRSGFTVWLTGLPCSGKSTISHELARALLDRGVLVEMFDGDIVRENLSKGLGFSRADRDTNVLRIGFVANLVARNGAAAIVAAVSPYESTRAQVRAQSGDFVEVHVNASLSTCEDRDVKGMYKKARAGEMKNFTGVDDPYEPPVSPDVRVDTAEEEIAQSVGKILTHLVSRGLLTESTEPAAEEVARAAVRRRQLGL